MEQYYWLSRKGEEMDMARWAASPEARLVHQELATRYETKAKAAEADVLAALGIAMAPADQYLVNGHRHTTAGDALAEAKRDLAQ